MKDAGNDESRSSCGERRPTVSTGVNAVETGSALDFRSPRRRIGLNISTGSGSPTVDYPQELNALSAVPFD